MLFDVFILLEHLVLLVPFDLFGADSDAFCLRIRHFLDLVDVFRFFCTFVGLFTVLEYNVRSSKQRIMDIRKSTEG